MMRRSVVRWLVLAALVGNGTSVERFEVATPSLNEIFIRVVQEAS